MNDMKRFLLAIVVALSAATIVAAEERRHDCCCCPCDCTNSCCCCPDSSRDCCGCTHFTNKTIFIDRVGWFQSGTYLHESLFSNKRMSWRQPEDECCPWGTAIQIVPFGGRMSGSGTNRLGEYLGYNHKSTGLVVTNQVVAASGGILADDAHFDAEHFNIEIADQGAFTSTIGFCPKQSFGGCGLSWKQALWRHEDDTIRFWGELSAPVVHVSNRTCFTEDLDGATYTAATGNGLDDSPFVASMASALTQSKWKAGKFCDICTTTNDTTCCSTSCCSSSCCSSSCCNPCCCSSDCCNSCCSTNCCGNCCNCMKVTRLTDLELKFGYNFVMSDCCWMDGYVGVVFPTGNAPTSCCVFEALAGSKHWGIMWGSNINYTIWNWDCGTFETRFDIDARYLFGKCETRLFDLVGKPWSRYMAMFQSAEAAQAAITAENVYAGTSGVNIMARCVDVRPGCQLNINTGFVYNGECFLGELGLTCYARQAERICPNWYADADQPALKAHQLTGNDVLTRARTIRDRFTGSNATYSTENYNRYKIKSTDVDWMSAEHPGMLHTSFYGSLGYQWGGWCYPTFLSVGAAYDVSCSNTGMRRWTLFGKLGVSF
ncbi:MAG: hypothetical protein JW725_01080 [Candidatus Babeliaceae bacterium]|nr:hypothetical protein [Candidatus Babeliaceae bacterium]